MLNVLSVIAGFQRNAGPSHTLKALREHLSPLVGENVLAFPRPDGARGEMLAIDPQRVDLHPIPSHVSSLLRRSFSSGFATALRVLCREHRIQILHNHGLWLPCNHAAASVAVSLKIPLIVTTHGMLAPWAMAHKKWKKRLAWRLYQKRDLQHAACLHATAEHEYRHMLALGLRQPVAVIPNGIEAPAAAAPRKSTDGPRTILFVGRIYPVKGLLNLVAAWAKIRASGWRIVIAGPDQAGHQAEVRRAIADAGLKDFFEFPGPVHDEAKWDLYRAADLFVLPSFTENFGMVVAEALACGVPVITTRGAPWAELEERGCGWWVDIGAEPLAAALREAMALGDAERREMGARGRRLVEEKYAWPGIAKQMVAVYEWILGRGPKPDCVRLD